MAFTCMVIGILLLIIQFPILIMFTSSLQYCETDGCTDFGNNILGTFILIQIPFTLVQMIVFAAMWLTIRKSLASMLIWHDYLVAYK